MKKYSTNFVISVFFCLHSFCGDRTLHQYMSDEVEYVITRSAWDVEFDNVSLYPCLLFVAIRIALVFFEKGKKPIVIRK
ncbi:unnamed protein product [Schistosoma curassoni]|uniref:Lipoprotein n=1 Tax=Schistosoma curassoni TaxID=6186 RepID=A0A183K9N0_9TREM|nr:unnamed protein product [Schistosoma curassoni]